ncbi:MAG: pyridoxal phosphate-dependent aminotransferase [Pseudomonadota bacterium]
MAKISQVVERLPESPISNMFKVAADIKAAGRDVIDLTFGEPGFPTPVDAANAGIDAIKAGQTKYTANAGTPEMRASVQLKFKRDYGLDLPLNRVLSGPGAKNLIFSVMQSTLDPGDEVIVPTPYYPVFEGMPLLLGCDVRHVSCSEDTGFKLTADTLRAAIGPKSRLLILNSPSNPTGAVYSREELSGLAEVLRDHPTLWILSDDVYENIIFDDQPFTSLIHVAPDLEDRIVIVNGVSKGYAMTGWRLGYVAASAKLIVALEAVISQTATAAPTMSQVAAIAALEGDQGYLADRCKTFQTRRDKVVDAINAMNGLSLLNPEGGIFAFFNISDLIGRSLSDGRLIDSGDTFAMALLQDQAVALVPGNAFGAPHHVRLSLGVSDKLLEEALVRIDHFVEGLTTG